MTLIDTGSPVSLIEALAFCMEKEEILDGWCNRYCPMPSEEVAVQTFDRWVAELTLLKGGPELRPAGTAKRAEWLDMRVKQQGRGIVFWISPNGVWDWWQDSETWEGDPVDSAMDWD